MQTPAKPRSQDLGRLQRVCACKPARGRWAGAPPTSPAGSIDKFRAKIFRRTQQARTLQSCFSRPPPPRVAAGLLWLRPARTSAHMYRFVPDTTKTVRALGTDLLARFFRDQS